MINFARLKFRSLLSVWLVFTVVFSQMSTFYFCSPKALAETHDVLPKEGLDFKLSEGKAQLEESTTNPVVNADPLSEEETNKLLKLLPSLEEEKLPVFTLPGRSLPPPNTQTRITEPFPPTQERALPAKVKSKPLTVTSKRPLGQIDRAANISVTFSQPMVPVSSQETVSAIAPPITLSPSVTGEWKWYGTQTLTFEPQGKTLPMSTAFNLQIPQGTKSANGSTMTSSENWTFSTGTTRMTSHYPEGYQTVKPTTLIMVRFNQKVDPDSILGVTKITSSGSNFSAVAATKDEIAGDVVLAKRLKDVPAGMYVVFKASEPLPARSTVTVTIGPGTKSAEGPLVAKKTETFVFRTYGPLNLIPPDKVLSRPEEPLLLRFTNALETKSFKADQVKVTPSIPDMNVQVFDTAIAVSGLKRANTTYHFEMSSKLQDQFGQFLTGNRTCNFAIAHVEKQLYMPISTIIVPSKPKPHFPLTTVNLDSLDIKIYSVTADQYPKYLLDIDGFMKHAKVTHQEKLKIKNEVDHSVVTELDLSRWLNDGRGSLIISVSTRGLENSYEKERSCWIQCTNLGLDVFADANSLLIWATDLETGAPIKGAKIAGTKDEGVYTNEQGLVTVQLARLSDPARAEGCVATHGKDAGIVGEAGMAFSGERAQHDFRWYVITDRAPYRPGETINVKGIIRKRRNSPNSELSTPSKVASIKYAFSDNSGNAIGKGQTDMNKFGAFDLSFKLPDKVNLGQVQLQLDAATDKGVDNSSYTTSIQVAEFRRPEFELKVKNEGESDHIIGGSTTVSASTSYYAGGSLQHTDIHWSASASSTNYNPPGWDGFLFGRSQFPIFDFFYLPAPKQLNPPQELTAKTDGNGKHFVRLDFLGVHPAEPSTVNISATVQDVNRQTWTDSTSLLVHPSSLYVGTKISKAFVKKGSKQPISLIVTGIDGKAKTSTEIKIKAWRSSYDYSNGNGGTEESHEKKEDVQTFTSLSNDKPVNIDVEPHLDGLYKVSTTIVDDQGRANETVAQFWVEGGEVRAKPNPNAEFEVQKLLLLPEKSDLKPGDQAIVLVQSPFAPADGVATVWHDGISSSQPFHMNEKSYQLKIPITVQHMPDIRLQVDVVGAGKETEYLKPAPAEASNSVNFKVSTDSKKLTVEATPDAEKSEPGKQISINLAVTDHEGNLVPGAEVAVAVVDDALLSLANYHFADPIDTFYSAQNAAEQVLRERVKLDMTAYLLKPKHERVQEISAVPPSALPPIPMPGAAFGGAGEVQFQMVNRKPNTREKFEDRFPALTGATNGTIGPQGQDATYVTAGVNAALPTAMNALPPPPYPGQPVSVQLRSNFDALAKWAPSTVTDEKGHAQIKLKLPDNLTRYRIMAVASHGGEQFGTGESSLTVRLPLMAKPSPPRFLNFGDKFELPVVVQNQTDAAMDVSVATRATNAIFTKGQGRHLSVPANDRVEIRFPASTVHSGKTKFQVIVASGATTDAALGEFPVYTPATTEAFATYGQIDQGSVEQLVQTPSDIIPDFGALEVTSSTTILETVTDAFLYINNYQFECSEQLSSRLISVALLKDMLKAFHVAGMPSEAEIQKSVAGILQKLQSRQQPNGSFALWSSNELKTYPYVTLHVAHALLLSKAAGYAIPQPMLDRAITYIKNINNYISDYKGDGRIEIQASALYLRNLNGEDVTAKALSLLKTKQLELMPLESLGLLWKIFAQHTETASQSAAIRSYISNLIVETAGTAQIAPRQDSDEVFDYRLFGSPMRENAILLDAYITDGTSPELITKLMKTLLGGRVKGRWGNTQENVYALLAVRHYFDKYEKTVPNLVAQAWLGKDFVGESTFKGHTSDYKSVIVPMSYMAQHPVSQQFVLKKEGSGRLYYRLGMSYAPKNLHLKSIDRGFSVSRSYEGAKDKSDVSRDDLGTWHFKSGSLIKVKLKMSAPAERFFVALVDPLPGGGEALNDELKGTETVPIKNDAENVSSESSRWWWWHMNWWDHENKRDNQAEIFANDLQGGTHEYSYLMRATTPGTFVVPPTKAEEMYSPETFGRAQTESVVIE